MGSGWVWVGGVVWWREEEGGKNEAYVLVGGKLEEDSVWGSADGLVGPRRLKITMQLG